MLSQYHYGAVFDFYAGPSARGRQLYCRACNFKNVSALLAGRPDISTEFHFMYAIVLLTAPGDWNDRLNIKSKWSKSTDWLDFSPVTSKSFLVNTLPRCVVELISFMSIIQAWWMFDLMTYHGHIHIFIQSHNQMPVYMLQMLHICRMFSSVVRLLFLCYNVVGVGSHYLRLA